MITIYDTTIRNQHFPYTVLFHRNELRSHSSRNLLMQKICENYYNDVIP